MPVNHDWHDRLSMTDTCWHDRLSMTDTCLPYCVVPHLLSMLQTGGVQTPHVVSYQGNMAGGGGPAPADHTHGCTRSLRACYTGMPYAYTQQPSKHVVSHTLPQLKHAK
jgi:hypothetical protein